VRLLTLVAPGGDGTRAALSGALAAWTRGLDIRLRFLEMGVEETVLALDAGEGRDAAAALASVERALARERPSVAVLHGRGPAALAAAVTASKAGLPLVRVGAGLRDGASADEDRAADRLASERFAAGEAALEALRAEGLSAEAWSPEAAVRAVIRLHREA
jgi:UDP-N-acetylglucosamine 2-epimerase